MVLAEEFVEYLVRRPCGKSYPDLRKRIQKYFLPSPANPKGIRNLYVKDVVEDDVVRVRVVEVRDVEDDVEEDVEDSRSGSDAPGPTGATEGPAGAAEGLCPASNLPRSELHRWHASGETNSLKHR